MRLELQQAESMSFNAWAQRTIDIPIWIKEAEQYLWECSEQLKEMKVILGAEEFQSEN